MNLDEAIEIARAAHRDQRDQAGLPYIDHPLRVMRRVAEMGGDDIAQAAAALHDVIEDGHATFDSLRERGASDVLLAALRSVTKHEGEDYLDFVRRAADPRGRLVKLADIEDNSDEVRLALLPPETADHLRAKYKRALPLVEG